MKKEAVKFFIVFFCIIILTGIISAENSCDIVLRDSCNDQIIMGLSAQTNAHGEVASQENYDYVLCCNFGLGDTTCTGFNKIIGLSAQTNAHAEIPTEDNYNMDVCYEGTECINLAGECDEEYPIEMLSLSAYTNAHIGEVGDYNPPGSNICCKSYECRIGEVNYCRDYTQEECSFDACGVAENSLPEISCGEGGIVCGCEWDDEIEECGPTWEEVARPPSCGDGELNSGEDCDGEQFGEITGCIDLGFAGGTLGCYPSGHEKECTLNIEECTGGVEGGICGDSEINNFPFETCDTQELNSKTCEDFGLSGLGLACYLSGNPRECTFDTNSCEIGSGANPTKIGKCNYNEDTEDDCEDKFLTYSWTATWTWGEDNVGEAAPCDTNYVLDGGLCYYDPNGAKAKCQDGSNTVPCPAQIQLPFFGWHSFILIAIAITIGYLIMKFKGKKKSKSRR